MSGNWKDYGPNMGTVLGHGVHDGGVYTPPSAAKRAFRADSAPMPLRPTDRPERSRKRAKVSEVMIGHTVVRYNHATGECRYVHGGPASEKHTEVVQKIVRGE